MKSLKTVPLFGLLLVSGLIACTKDDDGDGELGLSLSLSLSLGTEGDGDPGDGDPGDGDPGDGDPGDGDPGDGDPGDGDPGDGDPGDGDPGDGDGDPVGCGADPGWGAVAIGQPVKHIAAYNHLGEAVNVCDWAGTPIVMDLSALWCGPCHMASEYLATGATQDPFSGIGPDLRAMIGDGSAIWLTFLVQDDTEGDATTMHAAAWDAMYHHDNIPVLNELDTPMLPNYLQVGCWPTAWVIDPELNFHGVDDCATWNQLAAMVTEFGG
jgi:hypothetical protein